MIINQNNYSKTVAEYSIFNLCVQNKAFLALYL